MLTVDDEHSAIALVVVEAVNDLTNPDLLIARVHYPDHDYSNRWVYIQDTTCTYTPLGLLVQEFLYRASRRRPTRRTLDLNVCIGRREQFRELFHGRT